MTYSVVGLRLAQGAQQLVDGGVRQPRRVGGGRQWVLRRRQEFTFRRTGGTFQVCIFSPGFQSIGDHDLKLRPRTPTPAQRRSPAGQSSAAGAAETGHQHAAVKQPSQFLPPATSYLSSSAHSHLVGLDEPIRQRHPM